MVLGFEGGWDLLLLHLKKKSIADNVFVNSYSWDSMSASTNFSFCACRHKRPLHVQLVSTCLVVTNVKNW